MLTATVGCDSQPPAQDATEPVPPEPTVDPPPAHPDVGSEAPPDPEPIDASGEEHAAELRDLVHALRQLEPSPLREGAALESLYEARHYHTILVRNGQMGPGGSKVVDALKRMNEHGLASERYGVEELETMLTNPDVGPVRTEVALLDAWLTAARDLSEGIVDPTTIHAEWNTPRRSADLVAAATEGAREGDFAGALFALAPQQPGYRRLVEALAQERASTDAAAKEKVPVLEANLERWRWMPADLGRRHVRVNIAAFEAEGWEDGAQVIKMRAIVGKLYRRTPVFSDEITHVVLNPRWSVPLKLAVKDKLPKIKKDPDYLKKNGFRVFRADTGAEVPASSVPWDQLSSRKFGYILRQEPGDDNALGRIKIMFPNDHDVYLHDTPKRRLFNEDERIFSSGCVRLEDPRALAAFVLDDPKWDRSRIDKAIRGGREQTVWLNEPVPVHLQYQTAWVDEDGTLQFRPDVYKRDAPLIAALRAAVTRSPAKSPPPAPAED